MITYSTCNIVQQYLLDSEESDLWVIGVAGLRTSPDLLGPHPVALN